MPYAIHAHEDRQPADPKVMAVVKNETNQRTAVGYGIKQHYPEALLPTEASVCQTTGSMGC